MASKPVVAGDGRTLEPEQLSDLLTGLAQAKNAGQLPRCWTAGPTFDHRPSTRCAASPTSSSWQDGYALARACGDVGAEVTLISVLGLVMRCRAG